LQQNQIDDLERNLLEKTRNHVNEHNDILRRHMNEGYREKVKEPLKKLDEKLNLCVDQGRTKFKLVKARNIRTEAELVTFRELFDAHKEEMERKYAEHEERIAFQEKKMATHEERINQNLTEQEQKMATLEQKMATHEERIEFQEKKMATQEEKMATQEEKMATQENHFSEFEIKLREEFEQQCQQWQQLQQQYQLQLRSAPTSVSATSTYVDSVAPMDSDPVVAPVDSDPVVAPIDFDHVASTSVSPDPAAPAAHAVTPAVTPATSPVAPTLISTIASPPSIFVPSIAAVAPAPPTPPLYLYEEPEVEFHVDPEVEIEDMESDVREGGTSPEIDFETEKIEIRANPVNRLFHLRSALIYDERAHHLLLKVSRGSLRPRNPKWQATLFDLLCYFRYAFATDSFSSDFGYIKKLLKFHENSKTRETKKPKIHPNEKKVFADVKALDFFMKQNYDFLRMGTNNLRVNRLPQIKHLLDQYEQEQQSFRRNRNHTTRSSRAATISWRA
jgi:hypothetical protein